MAPASALTVSSRLRRYIGDAVAAHQVEPTAVPSPESKKVTDLKMNFEAGRRSFRRPRRPEPS